MSFSANDAFLESSKASLTEVVAQLEIARSRKIRDSMRTKKCYIRLGLNSSFVGTKSVASSGVLFVPSFIELSSESFERLCTDHWSVHLHDLLFSSCCAHRGLKDRWLAI